MVVSATRIASSKHLNFHHHDVPEVVTWIVIWDQGFPCLVDSTFTFGVAQASKPLGQYGGCFDEGCSGHQSQSSKPSEKPVGGDAHLWTILHNTHRKRQSVVSTSHSKLNFLSEHNIKIV